MQLLFPLIVFGLMWVFLVRPQQQRVRRQRELIMSLEVGEEVVTAGGVVGTIVALDDDEVHLEVAPGIVLRFLRIAVNAKVGGDPPAGDDVEADEPEVVDDRGHE